MEVTEIKLTYAAKAYVQGARILKRMRAEATDIRTLESMTADVQAMYDKLSGPEKKAADEVMRLEPVGGAVGTADSRGPRRAVVVPEGEKVDNLPNVDAVVGKGAK